jgi:hypothetical protein
MLLMMLLYVLQYHTVVFTETIYNTVCTAVHKEVLYWYWYHSSSTTAVKKSINHTVSFSEQPKPKEIPISN